MLCGLRSIAVVAAASLVTGCYRYAPVDTASPPVGKRLALEISDRGRVGLAERFGTGVMRVEGTVVGEDSANYVMNVWSVSQLDGSRGTWAGERVRIDRDFVSRTMERQLSRERTYLFAGAAVAGLALFAKMQGLIGGADVSSGGEEPPPGQSSRAFPW